MKRITAIGTVILLMAMLTACNLPIQNTNIKGSGNVISEEREVTGFNKVSLEGIGDLQIVQGDVESLKVEAEDNIIDRIESYVTGSVLHIGVERFINVIPTSGISYTLTVKDLNSIEISGYGDVYMQSLTTDSLVVEVSGGGRINIENLSADSLDVELSGAGDFDLAGVVDQQYVKLSGAGSYKAPDLQSRTATVNISGAGTAQLWVTEDLDVNLSGVGSLQYYGDARVHQNISGIGKVISLGVHE